MNNNPNTDSISGSLTQQSFRYKLDWGWRGARHAAAEGDIVVIVDTLSFSSAVVTAVHGNAEIYPYFFTDDPATFAERVGAEYAVKRTEVPGKGRYSLSPLTYMDVEPGTRIVLPSPNGSTCVRLARKSPLLVIGTLLNAKAVADAVSERAAESDLSVTILACGEWWDDISEEGGLRFAIEDYIAAGAILSFIDGEKSPEAITCEGAFLHVKEQLSDILWDSGSGLELRESGFEEDVKFVSRLNLYDDVPVFEGNRIRKLTDNSTDNEP